MAAVRVFRILKDKIEAKGEIVPANQRAMFWLQHHATMLRNWQKEEETLNPTFSKLAKWKFSKKIVAPSSFEIGKMYFFTYDAKTKDTLPYWDALPLSIPIELYDDSALQLNLHYLDYTNRARLFDALYGIAVNKRYDLKTRMKVSYRLLKSAAALAPFKPCVKRHLFDHITSKGLIQIGSSEWDISIFLPCQKFQKASAQQVWRESRRLF